jgi:hypothetical protein
VYAKQPTGIEQLKDMLSDELKEVTPEILNSAWQKLAAC